MSDIKAKLKTLTRKIHSAKNLILTTHKMCDGDGLGSLLGIYHGLRKTHKSVRAITVDKVSKKYHFLSPEKHTENFDKLETPLLNTELALVFDTNDCRRIQPLYQELEKKCLEIIYIDHHPILELGPKPTSHSLVDISAASTGEICYSLLKELGIGLDENIAQALYVSIVFDTQRFHFIKNSGRSHKICADLLQYINNNENIYNQLFGITSLEKMNMLSQTIKQTEYFYQNQVAVIELTKEELSKHKLSIEDACDFLDMTLEVTATQMSVLIVTLSKNKYKLSFRSKNWDVSKIAEVFNGGGHKNSSGALLSDYTNNPKAEVLTVIKQFTNKQANK